MLTSIKYNCNPDSLGDVSPEDFVTAFENEVRSRPEFADLAIEVTFEMGASEITTFGSDDADADISHEAELQVRFDHFAERAFAECLS